MEVDNPGVRSTHVPYVPLSITPEGSPREMGVEALVDTGYTGFVVVPTGSLDPGPTPRFQLRLRLADGSAIVAPAYRGRIRIGRVTLESVAITEMGDTVILGMQVIGRFRLVIDHGRTIALEP